MNIDCGELTSVISRILIKKEFLFVETVDLCLSPDALPTVVFNHSGGFASLIPERKRVLTGMVNLLLPYFIFDAENKAVPVDVKSKTMLPPEVVIVRGLVEFRFILNPIELNLILYVFDSRFKAAFCISMLNPP